MAKKQGARITDKHFVDFSDIVRSASHGRGSRAGCVSMLRTGVGQGGPKARRRDLQYTIAELDRIVVGDDPLEN
jgi:hypothetical protein